MILNVIRFSGIQRRFDITLADTALKLVRPLLPDPPDIILGIDARTTRPLLAHPPISGILGTGRTMKNNGIVPTPTAAFCTRFAEVGCLITASHNAEE